MSEHTKTPWSVSSWIEQPNNRVKPMIAARGATLAITHPAPICPAEECEANARHIVRCVNNHDRLVDLLSQCSTELAESIEGKYHGILRYPSTDRDHKTDMAIVEEARALLSELEAKP